MIKFTERAAEKVKEIAKIEKFEGQGLRIRVLGGGCGGFAYDLYFDDQKPKETDELFESNGIAVYIDQGSYPYLEGTEIDYAESPMGEGFRFNNPNTSGMCGCGGHGQ